MKRRRKSPDSVLIALEAAGLSTEVARRLVHAGTPVTLRPGAALCREGEIGREAFVLVSGEALVRNADTERRVGAGEVIGEIAALNPQRRRTATVETTQQSVVLAFDVRTFRDLARHMGDVLAPDRAA